MFAHIVLLGFLIQVLQEPT